MLIDRGADVSARDEYERTPLHALHLALQWGEVEVTRTLIEHGTGLTAQNGDGDTSLHLVSSRSLLWNLQDYAGVADIVLLKYGADVNSRNKNGFTPFLRVPQVGFAEGTHVPLEHGADLGEMPVSESPPAMGPTHTVADLLILRRRSLTPPNVVDTNLLQTPSQLQPPLNEILILERNGPTVFFTRRFLCSIGIVAIAVALPFFYGVPQMLAIGRSA